MEGVGALRAGRRPDLRWRAKHRQEFFMQARIGIADSGKVVEIEVDDGDAFRAEIEKVLSGDQGVYWFTDLKRRSVGVPVARIAYVEIDPEDATRQVGFSPGT
jgi:hypothetical protein